jgi:integrase/recombinase XerC
VTELVDRFWNFGARGFSIESLGDVDPSLAEAFVRAPSADGEPAAATMHLRRSALRLLFRTARELGLADHDPTVDLVLPPRSSLRARPLSGEEVALCRAASLHSLSATRLPAAWALAEASARTSEVGHIRRRDVDLDQRRVWLRGSSKVEPRRAPLTDWGVAQLERRLERPDDDPERPVVYAGNRGSDYHRQAASCVAISEVLRRAGLATEPDVRPISVAAWAGHRVLAETGRIDEAARRLGMRSLDRTAALIGWDWTDAESTDA